MNLFSALFGGRTSKRTTPPDYGGSWFPVSGSGDRINEANLLNANREWVFVAVHRNAKSLSGVRFKVMQFTRSGDDQEIFAGPLVEFLESPAEGLTGKEFIYLNTAYKELTGNSFWEKVGRGKIAPLISTKVTPAVTAGKLVGYKYADPSGQQRTLSLDNVLHDRTPDLARPYWGKGKLAKVSRWVDTSGFAAEFLERFFIQGATFGGFIETEEETEERIRLIKTGLANDHVGVENAHKWGVLPKGSKATPNTSKMTDLEMGATDDRFRDKILAAFGVPKTLIGLTTEVNRASAESSEYIYAKYTEKPLADDLIEFLNVKIAPMLDATGKQYFAYDDFIPKDAANDVAARQSALGNQPYKTVNEVRALDGLPPVEGGDVVYGNPMLAPLGTPAPAPAPAPANDDDPEPKDDAPKKAIPARARQAFARDRAVSEIAQRVLEVVAAHHDPDADAHKSFVSRVEDHQKLLAGKVRDFNNKQQREVTARLSQLTKAIKTGDLFDMDGDVALLVDFVSPLLQGLLTEQAIAEFTAQEFPGTFDQHQPRIREIIRKAAKRLALKYNATTATLLAKQLNEGIKNGEDLTQLTDRVQKIYAFSDQVRAAAVANTEAFYIANEGSREAYRQSGVVTTVRWYTAEDEKVCEFCGPEDGEVIDIDDEFYAKGDTVTGRDGGTLDLDYRSIDVPPLHTNCRCFIRPETISVS